MRIEPSEDQSMLLGTLDRLAERYAQPSSPESGYVDYSADLAREVRDAGFLDLARVDGYGPLEAALLVERIARLPCSAEIAASALVVPVLDVHPEGAFALCEGIGRPTRFLPQASHACVIVDDDLYLTDLRPGDVSQVPGVIAYPLGTLATLPPDAIRLEDTQSERVRCMWRIAIAAEAAGLMRGALDLTVNFVKDRRQFRQPLGDFQAVQHRLAVAEQIVAGARLLSLRAAYSMSPEDAAAAALYVQEQMRTVIYDCHQFHGAMGLTLEYPLHLWTYRLKFLQGELGGRAAQAEVLAGCIWDDGPDCAAQATSTAETLAPIEG